MFMKICFISNLYKPFIFGGAENSVRRLAEGLVAKGHQVLVITTSPNRKSYTETINGVKIYRIHPYNIYPMYTSAKQTMLIKPLYYTIDLWNPFSYVIIKKILRQESPDLVHVNNFRGVSLSAFNAIKKLNIPLIFTARDYSLMCIKGNLLTSSSTICKTPSVLCQLYNYIQKRIVNKKPDVFTAPSQFVIDKFKSNGYFKNVTSIEVPNAININKKNIKSLKKNYETINILYVGALSKHKGVHNLILAFKTLNYQNINLHVIGKGENEGELKELAGSDRRIIFHGFKDSEQIISFYEKSHITVVPSIWYEPFGLVIIESFNHGIAVIGSRIGAIPKIIEDGYNGYLYEPNNETDLRNKLDYLLKKTSALKEMQNNAFESAKKYDLTKQIESYENIYRHMIEN